MDTATVIEYTTHDDPASHLMALKERALSAVMELTDEEQKYLLDWMRENVSDQKKPFERNCIA